MLPKQPIEDLIKDLQRLYDLPANGTHKHYYSKLALLEFSGWLEAVQDDIILNYANPKVADDKNSTLLNTDIVGKNYGCAYKEHMRSMLIKVIGLTNLEKLETAFNANGDLTTVTSQLGSIWSLRSSAAHTSMAGVMPTYQAPSTMLTYLNTLHPLLTNFEIELNRL